MVNFIDENRDEYLLVEVVDPDLVEVAEQDVARAVRDEVDPVVEGLPVVSLEALAARLHLDEQARLPDEIDESLSPTGSLDRLLELRPRLLHARVTEGAEEVFEEELGFLPFVPLQFGRVGYELVEGGDHVTGRRGHGVDQRDPASRLATLAAASIPRFSLIALTCAFCRGERWRMWPM